MESRRLNPRTFNILQALVVCRAPGWQVVITSLPNCTPLTQIALDQVSSLAVIVMSSSLPLKVGINVCKGISTVWVPANPVLQVHCCSSVHREEGWAGWPISSLVIFCLPFSFRFATLSQWTSKRRILRLESHLCSLWSKEVGQVPYVFHFLKGIPTPSSGAVVLLCPKCDRRGALHWARRDLSHEEKRWFDLFCCFVPHWIVPQATLCCTMPLQSEKLWRSATPPLLVLLSCKTTRITNSLSTGKNRFVSCRWFASSILLFDK